MKEKERKKKLKRVFHVDKLLEEKKKTNWIAYN